MGQVVDHPRRHRARKQLAATLGLPEAEVSAAADAAPFDPERIRVIGAQLGGLIDAGVVPITRAAPPAKVLVADGEAFVWTYPAITEAPAPRFTPLQLPELRPHQLPGWRPFHGVVWQPTPRERAEAERRRRRASHAWLKEIFARGR